MLGVIGHLKHTFKVVKNQGFMNFMPVNRLMSFIQESIKKGSS